MERETTCCFTGHRPDKLPWGENEQDYRCQNLKIRIMNAVEEAYSAGFRHFIVGMAQGADLYFAEAILAMRQRHGDVTLEAARPYEGQADAWSLRTRERYFRILDQADYETLVQHEYSKGCLIRRNHYMVDRSARIIAVYNGEPEGGTAQTLAYAMKKFLVTDILSVG